MRELRVLHVVLLGALLPLGVDAQTVQTITAGGLGYAVPLPVDSLTPVAGFRSFASLEARYLDLATQKDFISISTTGASVYGRSIRTYRFSSAGTMNLEGIPKSAAMIEGTIHAREWASTEVVAGIFEWLSLESDSDPVAGFLIDNTEIAIHPIANPDGFLQTQRFPAASINGGTSGASGRDGRMRRKNMQGVDEQLDTTGDYLFGVDLNRNHSFGFGGGSASLTSLEYHGASPGSEPESQALYAAAGQVDGDRLRMYLDFHSFSQLYYVIVDENAARNAAATDAYTLMRNVTQATSGRVYSSIIEDLTTGAIGATDEYFTGTYGAMSYTVELRPTSFGQANGFILPESQVGETRAEMLASTRAGLYYAAGPAALLEVGVYDTTTGRIASAPLRYRQQRVYTEETGGRMLATPLNEPLPRGRVYTAVLRFNKPMRLGGTGGSPTLFPGVSASVNGTVSLMGLVSGTNAAWVFDEGGGAFGYANYPGDTLLVDVDLRVASGDGVQTLSVDVADMAGKLLDADPRTVADWSRQGWVNWEDLNGSPGKGGGPDRLALVTIAPPEAVDSDGWVLH